MTSFTEQELAEWKRRALAAEAELANRARPTVKFTKAELEEARRHSDYDDYDADDATHSYQQ